MASKKPSVLGDPLGMVMAGWQPRKKGKSRKAKRKAKRKAALATPAPIKKALRRPMPVGGHIFGGG